MLDSSIWWEKAQRDIFITALLMAVPHELREATAQLHVEDIKPTGWKVPAGWFGFIPAAGSGLIRRAMVEMKDGMAALKALGEPDRESKSKAHDGRRLVRIDGGYIALNFIEYRERDHTAAERSKRWRERQKTVRAPGTKPNGKKNGRIRYDPKERAIPDSEAKIDNYFRHNPDPTIRISDDAP